MIQCPFCKKYFNASYAKTHIKYKCKLNPQHDIKVTRRYLLLLRKRLENTKYRDGALYVIDLLLNS